MKTPICTRLGGWHVTITGRYSVVLSLACGAQYWPIAEIVQELAMRQHMGLLIGMWLE